jgi:hypothetical protein
MATVRRRLRRWRRRSVPLLWTAAVLGGLILGLVVLVGISLPGLRDHLTQARSELTAAQNAGAAGNLEAARAHARKAASAADRARKTTDRASWRLADRAPFVGTAIRETRGLAAALAMTTANVLPPLLQTDLRPPRWTGRVDPAPFVAAREPLARSRRALSQAQARLDATPRSGVGTLQKAHAELEDGFQRLADAVNEATTAATVVPELTGSPTTKRYFLAVQNNAEPRATGGLVGAYGILRADSGRLDLERVGSDQDLHDPATPPLDLGPEYAARYSRFGTTSGWRSANLSPDVPTVGRILSALWTGQTREHLDGTVLVDPVALALLLGATGPVTLTDGTRLTEGDAVQVLLSDVYRHFPRSQDAARNEYLQEAARRVFGALSRPRLDGRKLADRIVRAVGSGHLQVWSADPSIERSLARSRAGGALPTAGPFLEVVTQDFGGSKLGVYQRRAISYDARPTGEAVDLGSGPESEEAAVVTVRLHNTAPAHGLPAYVTLRPDAPSSRPGQSKTWLSVYLGPRATVAGVTLDGAAVATQSDTEEGLSVFSLVLTVDPGQTRTVVLRVRQPATAGQPLRYRQQPLVVPDDLAVHRQGARRAVDPVYVRP